MKNVNLQKELTKIKRARSKNEDVLLREVDKILQESMFSAKHVLDNLKHYNQTSELIDENEVSDKDIYTLEEIKALSLKFRLRFVDSQCFRSDFPEEAITRIGQLNIEHKKTLKGFKILTTHQNLKLRSSKDEVILFAPTTLGNYFLIYKWGAPLSSFRAIRSWPLKNIETLFVTLLVLTAVITLCLPTYLITLDRKATYWCAYRIGIFFHLFIFNMGVTAYITFAFSKNLSSSVWNTDKDL